MKPLKIFCPMDFVNGSFISNNKVKFKKVRSFKPTTVDSVIEFAYDMTFGSKGEHRHTRSGGSKTRDQFEILANTFQGKLSEFAIANVLYKHKDFIQPDLSTHSLGIWEDADFKLGHDLIAVKSTKFYGNLILLESKDWDSEGKYLASVGELRSYSHIILVRVMPDIEKVLEEVVEVVKGSPTLTQLKKFVLAKDWSYDLPGYITNSDLIYVMQQGFTIPKGAFLNHSVKMDAENIYVQAGDLRPIKDLIYELHL